MIIKPLFDRIVLVRPEEINKGSILLPSSAQEKPNIAIVHEVGRGGELDGNKIEIVVNKGDKVLYNKYVANEFTIDDKEYTLIKQSDILAIIE